MKLTDFTTLSFDCYGTLIDWETGLLGILRPWAARHGLAQDAEALLSAYGRHEHAIEDANPTMLYADILRAVMRAIATEHGLRASDAEAEALAVSIGDWPPFADTPAALAYLKQHYKLAVLSNVDRASFARTQTKLGVALDAVVTAEEVGSYKPDPRNFRALLERLDTLGVAPGQVLHTAQSLYHDIAPARQLGLATNWINRRHDKPGVGASPASEAEPHFTFNSLADFADAHRAERAG
ncbi:MAG: haloacid dehalogenase type II [Alphaproteobacteria bacterium]|jgi:2-haloalkanoic acid dehalogenase type II|nr:haloacid dehalogenase type II [Alphaproteobacteria bacterium]MDP6517100.1 haloacid dehalogenase type II [Alphaproteobacteria bacterium]